MHFWQACHTVENVEQLTALLTLDIGGITALDLMLDAELNGGFRGKFAVQEEE